MSLKSNSSMETVGLLMVCLKLDCCCDSGAFPFGFDLINISG